MRHWLGITDAAYVARAVERGLVLFSGGWAEGLDGVTQGDRVAFYAPSASHAGAPCERLVALGTVHGPFRRIDDLAPGFRAWVRDCDYDEVPPVPFAPLARDIWGRDWRDRLTGAGGRLELDAGTFARIERHMRMR